jgi:hypothetical protein
MARLPLLVWSLLVLACGSSASSSQPDAASPSFPTGIYSCESSLSIAGTYQGMHWTAVGGGNGTLAVTQAGSVVTAAYTGDSFVSGTMTFTVTSPGSAEPTTTADETMNVLCLIPGDGPMQSTSIAAGTLTMDGTTLFLSFSGTMQPGTEASACDGLTVPGTLTCAARP